MSIKRKDKLTQAMTAAHSDSVVAYLDDHADQIAQKTGMSLKASGLYAAMWDAGIQIAEGLVTRKQQHGGGIVHLRDRDALDRLIGIAIEDVDGCCRYPTTGHGHGSSHPIGVPLNGRIPAATVSPEGWLAVEQQVRQKVRENNWHRYQMREAQRNDRTLASGYRGKPIPLRSLERHKAAVRVARSFGQMEIYSLSVDELDDAMDGDLWEFALSEALAARQENQQRKRGWIGQMADRIAAQIEAEDGAQMAFHGHGFDDQTDPEPEPPKPNKPVVSTGWRKHRLPSAHEQAVPPGWHEHAMPTLTPGLAGGAA